MARLKRQIMIRDMTKEIVYHHFVVKLNPRYREKEFRYTNVNIGELVIDLTSLADIGKPLTEVEKEDMKTCARRQWKQLIDLTDVESWVKYE